MSNPEFVRNLWLELTPGRLISMPLVLGAIFFLAYVSDDSRFAESVAVAAMSLYAVITLLWGTRLASESVLNEVRDHTWDGQRMSSLTPWQLSWGKLFGSTIYPWYGALICLSALMIADHQQQPGERVVLVLSMVFTAILAHSFSLLASLSALQRERTLSRSHAIAVMFLGLLIAGPFFNLALSKTGQVDWYGIAFNNRIFLLVSVASWAAWGVIGLYRQMRRELQLHNGPLLWFGFLFFTMTYVSGFFHEPDWLASKSTSTIALPSLVAASLVALFATYVMALLERKDHLTLRELQRCLRAGSYRRLWERMPRWLLSLPVAGAAMLAAALTARNDGTSAVLTAVSMMLFTSRDLGILIYFSLAKSNRRAEMIAFLWFGMLYAVIPMILSAMQLPAATVLFWPRFEHTTLAAAFAPAAEIAALFWLLSKRWQQRAAEVGNATPVTSA